MSAPELTWDDELRQAELAALRRLRQLSAADDPRVALRACEALTKLVARARREQARPAPRDRAEPARRPEPPPAPRREPPPAPTKARAPHLPPDGAPLG